MRRVRVIGAAMEIAWPRSSFKVGREVLQKEEGKPKHHARSA